MLPTKQSITKTKEARRRAEGDGPTHQVVAVGELGHGGALAAGDNEGVEAEELLRLSHLHAPHRDPPQRCTPTQRPAESTTRPSTSCPSNRANRIPYRPGARCRSPAARGRPPPPLPSPPLLRLGTRGLVGGRERRLVVGWWLVTSRGAEWEGWEGRKKPHVAEAAAATRG